MQHLLLVEFKVFFFSFFLIFPQKIGDSLPSWQRKRREAARSWSDVDVWRSLFHSPLAMDKEEEVTGPARSLCAAVTSTGRPPRELQSQYGAECRAARNWISLPANPIFLLTPTIGISPPPPHTAADFAFCSFCPWRTGLSQLLLHLSSELGGWKRVNKRQWFKAVSSGWRPVGGGQTDSCPGQAVAWVRLVRALKYHSFTHRRYTQPKTSVWQALDKEGRGKNPIERFNKQIVKAGFSPLKMPTICKSITFSFWWQFRERNHPPKIKPMCGCWWLF